MAQHGAQDGPSDGRRHGASPAINHSTSSSMARGDSFQGANAALLMGMMNCVDTSLFSPQQLQNWEQMKTRIKMATENKIPLTSEMISVATNGGGSHATEAAPFRSEPATTTNTHHGEHNDNSIDFRTPLHREASIQDVLACLLDQQPPSFRVMNSSGGSYLVNSEVKKTSTQAAPESQKPTLKSLLSSNDFSMTEKKESLKHLLSFIDNSFASNPEPLTDVYRESKEGNLRRLSSLQLMRNFLTPNPNAQSMGRTTSFEIIQAMLNATSNQAIQKPMSSQDSFRFQHLANCLEAIESDVAYDNDMNEDYGNEEVVQVDNLDNLLEYHGPPSSSSTHASSSSTAAPPPLPQPHIHPPPANSNLGFVDTQSLINPSRSIYSEIHPHGHSGMYPPYESASTNDHASQHMYGSYQPTTPANSSASVGLINAIPTPHGMMYQQQVGSTAVKMEPPYHHHQEQQQHHHHHHQQQQQFGDSLQFHSMIHSPQTPMMGNGYGDARKNPHMAQQYAHPMMMQPQAMLQPHHQQQHPHQQYAAQRISAQQTQQKKEAAANGGGQICSALGCNHLAKVKGMCKLHGGGRRCKVDGCMKSAQTGHLCIAHGGGKPCNVEGCPKTAQSRGLCKQHGGGVRCKFEGCTKSCQSGGFCRGHGGGKRCEYPSCTKWAQKNGHCAKHAQEVAQKLQQQQQMGGMHHP